MRLTARPAESEHPVTEINHFQEQQSFAKIAFKISFNIFMFTKERKSYTLRNKNFASLIRELKE
jgi:hypothetical protein